MNYFDINDLKNFRKENENPNYALIGENVTASLSPLLMSVLSNDIINYYAYNIKENELDEAMKLLVLHDFKGLNVTSPYKEKILKYCEGTTLEYVHATNASNCIVIRKNAKNKHLAFNTDFLTLKYYLSCNNTTCKYLILGSGAMARNAVMASINTQNQYENNIDFQQITVAARSPEKIKNTWKATTVKMIDNILDIKDIQWENLSQYTQIINCTSLGSKEGDPSPIPLDKIHPDIKIIDCCYGSHFTELEKQAAIHKKQYIDGKQFLKSQAICSYNTFVTYSS